MATYSNTVIVGHAGGNAEPRTTQSGDMVVNLSIATSYSWKDKQDEWQERTEWHRVVHWGDTDSKNIKKGELVFVEGRMETRKWTDKSGDTRYSTELKARKVIRISAKKDVQPQVDDSDDLPF